MSLSIIFLAIGILLFLYVIFAYNSLTSARNQIDNAFSALDAMLKKRFDLIPNLVATIKNYALHEQTTLTNLTELRTKALNNGLNQTESVQLDNQFSEIASRLVIFSENYPTLQANVNFLQLQRAINESEEQIAAARRNYNASVTDYNNMVQQFPSNIAASLFNFSTRTLLNTPEAQRENPNVNQLFQ